MNIIDLHCDTLDKLKNKGYEFKENSGHISEKSLIDGGYISQCYAIYTPAEIIGEKATGYFEKQYKVFVEKIRGSEIIPILTVENGEFLNNNIDNLKLAQNAGVRLFGFLHNNENCLGFPCAENKNDNMRPLKPFGKTVAQMLNFTNIYADVSHLNLGGFYDLAEISKKPIVASHSGSFEVYKHKRNLTDEQIKIIGASGGVVGIVFYSYFLNGTNKAEISDIIRHIEHFIKVGGEDIAALGSDFDGMTCNLEIKNASEMQKLCDALIKKFGFNLAEKICYKNANRLF